GSIAWKQDKKFGRHFDVGFGNPDFVALAQSFGMSAWRCQSAGDLQTRLREALALDLPSLIVVPIDYSLDVAKGFIELGAEAVAAARVISAERSHPSSFASMPSTHFSARTREELESSLIESRRLRASSGTRTFSSNWPCEPATVIAASLPITCAETWITTSGI